MTAMVHCLNAVDKSSRFGLGLPPSLNTGCLIEAPEVTTVAAKEDAVAPTSKASPDPQMQDTHTSSITSLEAVEAQQHQQQQQQRVSVVFCVAAVGMPTTSTSGVHSITT
jgi:hypothetical protein